MIKGIGNDILEIKRFDELKHKEHFLSRCFTEAEIAHAKGRTNVFAADFSVKESVSKMFGTGVRGFELKEIEVLRDSLGKPYVKLYGAAKKLSESLDITAIHVSISDSKEYVSTVAVGE